jgi:protein SCO1/2
MMLRLIRWSAIGLIAVIAIGWGLVWAAQRDPASEAARLVHAATVLVAGRSGLTTPGPGVGGPFSLTDMDGHAVTDATYRGRWMLVYFGYAYCPDICPTELQTISTVLDQLGPEAVKIAPLFITIDPQRDTPQALAQYVKLFDSRLIGLTGTPEQTAQAAKAYRVYAARVTSKGLNGYLIDHTSFVYLMDPDGKLRTVFSPETSVMDMVAAVAAQISGGGNGS